MSRYILVLIFVLAQLSVIESAFAGGSKHLTAIMTFSCLDLNGIPIPADSDLANQCCSNGSLVANAPSICTSGPNTINTGAFGSIASNMDIANKTLGVANALNGIVTAQGSPGPSSGSPSTSAITAGGLGTNAAGGSLGDTGGSLPSGVSNGGSGGGAGGGSGGGGGANPGVPSVGNTSPAGNPSASDTTAPYVVAGYVKGNGSGAAAGNAFANSFGGGGGGAKATGDLKEMKFGDDGSDGKLGADANGVDPSSITGSPNDAIDYLSRIDKTANLFKIVSTRYTKETLKKHVGHE